jgi:hypothetical protein
MEDVLVKFRFLLSMIIPLFYVGMGIYVIIEKTFMVKLKPEYAYSLGVILVLYGIFRFYRAYTYLNDIKNKP